MCHKRPRVSLSTFEKEDSHRSQIEVYEVLGLMCHVGPCVNKVLEALGCARNV
jgi:hypothetical protein